MLSVSFRAVIFDFDGLIIDSETSIFDIWSEIYRDHGGQLTMDHWRHALGTHNGFDPYAELAAPDRRPAVARDVGAPRARRALAPVRGRAAPARSAGPAAGSARGGLPAAVASSSSLEWVGPWLSRHGLRDLVRAVCTRNDVARVKPAPDLFLLAAERLGVAPPECVVFEDTPNGVAAAHAAGMWAVAVPSPLTRTLEFPAPHVTLDSLAARTLAELQQDLAGRTREPMNPGT